MKDSTKISVFAVFLFLIILLIAIVKWPSEIPEANESTIEEIGRALFDDYGILVVLTALVLVGAMLGAVFLAKEER